MLLAFTGYLDSAQFDPSGPLHQPFPQWMEKRVELRSILMRLLRRNSMAALELHVTVNPRGISEASGMSPAEELEEGSKEGQDVVAQRAGALAGGCRSGPGV